VAQADLIVHVVDGSHPDPERQLAAVREVFDEIGAADVPELVAVNKADVADPMVVSRLLAREPHAVACSARTGDGIDKLVAAIEADLPRPEVEVRAVLPYSRGDLVNAIHERGEVLEVDHTAEGTLVVARVHPDLAGVLERYAVAAT
jgi:GTPase